MSYKHPYTWQERNQLIDNIRKSREIVRPATYNRQGRGSDRFEPIRPPIDKLCALIAAHDFIPSEDGDYKLNVE